MRRVGVVAGSETRRYTGVHMSKAVALSEEIFGWTRGDEAQELAKLSAEAPPNAVIVEIGSFLGSGTVLLAEPRRQAGSGKVHAIDPFDGSGDSFSVPYYADALMKLGGATMRQQFDRAIAKAGVADFVEVHVGPAAVVAADWQEQIDLLYLDGDQSIVGAQKAYDAWWPYLKIGAIIAVHNANPGPRNPEHDGMLKLVESVPFHQMFADIRLIGTTVFGRKISPANSLTHKPAI
jgi:predicted O-methyltransferase YrrM